jgi:transposase-like protein
MVGHELPHCQTAKIVKNGTSRHGHQRGNCLGCQKTFGEKDRRLVAPEKQAAALAQYLEGVGQRATERLLGVSHNSITNWVKKAVAGQVLKATPAEKVAWVEADELWTYVAKKKTLAGSGGLLIVLPNASWAGRWGIVEPKQRSGWMRNFLTPPTSSLPPTSGTPMPKSSAKPIMSKAKPIPARAKA